MKNKWLVISSVSTGLGIVAGGIYLFFAEHSLLLSNNSWVLSAFWSAFMLWTFVLMFVAALLFNVLAFFELDNKYHLIGVQWTIPGVVSASEKRKQFLTNAEQFLQAQGKLLSSPRVGDEYKCLHGDRDKLVLIQQSAQAVDISQIRALFQQMLASDYSVGVIVSYAGVTNQAWIFAREANIELIDAKSLKKHQKAIREQQFAII